VLHKHHLIIRVGAGLIQFVYGSHSRLAADLTLDKNLFFLPFSRAFLQQSSGLQRSRVGRPASWGIDLLVRASFFGVGRKPYNYHFDSTAVSEGDVYHRGALKHQPKSVSNRASHLE